MKTYFVQDQHMHAKTLLKVFAFGTCLGLLVLFSSLFVAIGRAREMGLGAGTDVALGPLSLLRIDKIAEIGGGYALTFSFKSGLLLLFMGIYLLEALLVYAVPAVCAGRQSAK